jgi:hypothetical protein
MAANSALLVCAYDSAEKFRQNHLAGAISLAAFKSRLHAIPMAARSFSTVRDRMMRPLPAGQQNTRHRISTGSIEKPGAAHAERHAICTLV